MNKLQAAWIQRVLKFCKLLALMWKSIDLRPVKKKNSWSSSWKRVIHILGTEFERQLHAETENSHAIWVTCLESLSNLNLRKCNAPSSYGTPRQINISTKLACWVWPALCRCRKEGALWLDKDFQSRAITTPSTRTHKHKHYCVNITFHK